MGRFHDSAKRWLKRFGVAIGLGLAVGVCALPAQAAPTMTTPGYAHATTGLSHVTDGGSHGGGASGHKVH